MMSSVNPHPLMDVYRHLLEAYGSQDWWPGDSPLEIIVGAILTQATSWTNVEKAMDNLKNAGLLSPQGLRDIPPDELAAVIRPSGYFNVKARRLKAFIHHLWDAHEGNLDEMLASDEAALRRNLLAINGIGEETADDILLYAAKKPFFVIDAYTRRILERVGVGKWRKVLLRLAASLPRGSAARRPPLQRISRPAGAPRQGRLPPHPQMRRMLSPGNLPLPLT